MTNQKTYSPFTKVIAIVVSITLVMLGFPLPARAVPQLPKSEPQTAAVVPPEPAATVPETLKELQQNLVTLQALLTDDSNLRQRQASVEPVLLSVSDLKTQLDDLDAEVLNEFEDIEAQIRDQNLPDNILQRHFDAVARYHQNQQALLDALDALENAADTRRLRRETDQALQQVQALTPSKHIPFDQENLPVRFPTGNVRAPLETFDAFAKHYSSPEPQTTRRGVKKAPSDNDLAQTTEVQITPEIEEKAAQLEHDPVKIYFWVRNNIAFIPTNGAIQGAALCLETKQCNAVDTTSLLIALLRASGIHSRYVVGTVDIPIEKAVNWLKVSEPKMVFELLSQGSVPHKAMTRQGVIKTVRLEHVWADAWIDFFPSRGARHRKGDTWVPMDASFKLHQFNKGLRLDEAVPFDTAALLEAIPEIEENQDWVTGIDEKRLETVFSEYEAQLQAYADNHHPDLSLADTMDNYSIIPVNRSRLSMGLPYRLVVKGQTFATLPDSFRYSLTIKLYNSQSAKQLDNPSLSHTISLPTLSNLRLGLTYVPASDSDAQALANFIDADNVSTLPVYLFNLKPVLNLEDTALATGTAIGMGQSQYLTVIINDPVRGGIDQQSIITAGDEIVFGVNSSGVPKELIEKRYSAVDPHTAAENLHQTALHFWMEHDFFDEITAQTYQVRRVRLPSVGLFTSPLSVSYFFGIARNGVYKSRSIDVKQNFQAVVAPTSEAQTSFMLQAGIQGSYLENSVIEQLFDYEYGRGVSATQVLAEAVSQNIPVYTITKANLDSVLPLLSVSGEVKTDIINAIHAGQHAIVPQREIAHGDWRGAGYIIFDTMTGAGAYLIEGGLNGGFLGVLVCEYSKYPLALTLIIAAAIAAGILVAYLFGPAAVAVGAYAFRVAIRAAVIIVLKIIKKQIQKLIKKWLAKTGKKTPQPPKEKPGKKEGSCQSRLQVTKVSFLDDLFIYKDGIGASTKLADLLIEDPVWEDKNLMDFQIDKNEPVGYVSDDKIKVKVTFKITPPLKATEKVKPVTIEGRISTSWFFGGFTAKLEARDLPNKPKAGDKEYEATLSLLKNQRLPKRKTQFFDPMTIQWYTSIGDKNTNASLPAFRAGTTKHKVYVTLKKPLERLFDNFHLTQLHLATSNAGASDEVQAIKKTWELFETQSLTNWDGKPLYYYKRGVLDSQCISDDLNTQFLARFLTSGEGQCSAFEKLFQAALETNGIKSETVEVYAGHDDYILVNNWQFVGKPKLKGTGDYQWRLILNYEGTRTNNSGQKEAIFGTYPLNEDFVYGKLISLEGLAGQNSQPPLFAPAEKVCGVHYIVKVTDKEALKKGLKTFYYDPSYGVTYEGEKEEAERNFEKDAVAGYYKQFRDNEEKSDKKPNYFRARKPKPSEVNIYFTQ